MRRALLVLAVTLSAVLLAVFGESLENSHSYDTSTASTVALTEDAASDAAVALDEATGGVLKSVALCLLGALTCLLFLVEIARLSTATGLTLTLRRTQPQVLAFLGRIPRFTEATSLTILRT